VGPTACSVYVDGRLTAVSPSPPIRDKRVVNVSPRPRPLAGPVSKRTSVRETPCCTSTIGEAHGASPDQPRQYFDEARLCRAEQQPWTVTDPTRSRRCVAVLQDAQKQTERAESRAPLPAIAFNARPRPRPIDYLTDQLVRTPLQIAASG